MERPGGRLANRELPFFLMLDRSGSMRADGKIQALNTAVREALPHMRRVARENPNARVMIRAVAFSDDVRWITASPTPVESVAWHDLDAAGGTRMGQALSAVARELRMPPMTNRSFAPVIVLVTDGQPTDDFEGGLSELEAEPWGRRAVRVAISIGRDADRDVLRRFIADSSREPLPANTPDALVRFIQWASTTVLQSVSSAVTPAGGPYAVGVPVPTPPPAEPLSQAETW